MTRLFILFYAALLLMCSCKTNSDFVAFTYPEGKYKALVLSYDDGTIQDIQLAKLFDQNGLIGTFNLNSSYLGTTLAWPVEFADTIFQKYVPKDSLLIIYKNHEIAAHGAYHKDFIKISEQEILEEVNSDIKQLTALTQRKILSMAYPFGNTNESISKLISTTGISNARTVSDTYKFDLPENYFRWNPTCHDSKVLDYADEFLALDKKSLSLFYVWGHSWEFGDQKRWNNMLTFCEKMGKQQTIWSVGTAELTSYLQAIKRLQIKDNKISNPADNSPVWIELTTGLIKLNAGESVDVNTGDEDLRGVCL